MDSRKKALFIAKKMFAQFVYDFQSLEGMPFTFPEVQTFIQGITVGGHKIADQDKLRQQQLAWKALFDLVEQGQFQLSEETTCILESVVAKDEALEPGVLRDNAVSVSSGDFTYKPLSDKEEIRALFVASMQRAADLRTPIDQRGYRLAADYAYYQFHWDGNKRTGNLMMNGLFLSNGILPCPIPARRLLEYNRALMELYKTGNFQPVIEFHSSCHLEILQNWNNEDLQKMREN